MNKRLRLKQKVARPVWDELYDHVLAEIQTDPRLTDEEKAALLQPTPEEKESELIEVEGEPVSETIINLRGPRVLNRQQCITESRCLRRSSTCVGHEYDLILWCE
jgi:hypothetical protein